MAKRPDARGASIGGRWTRHWMYRRWVALITRISAGAAAAGESWAIRITQGANHTAAVEARKVA